MFTESSEATATFKIENTTIASKFPSYPLAISYTQTNTTYTYPHIPHRHTQPTHTHTSPTDTHKSLASSDMICTSIVLPFLKFHINGLIQ